MCSTPVAWDNVEPHFENLLLYDVECASSEG